MAVDLSKTSLEQHHQPINFSDSYSYTYTDVLERSTATYLYDMFGC